MHRKKRVYREGGGVCMGVYFKYLANGICYPRYNKAVVNVLPTYASLALFERADERVLPTKPNRRAKTRFNVCAGFKSGV